MYDQTERDDDVIAVNPADEALRAVTELLRVAERNLKQTAARLAVVQAQMRQDESALGLLQRAHEALQPQESVEWSA